MLLGEYLPNAPSLSRECGCPQAAPCAWLAVGYPKCPQASQGQQGAWLCVNSPHDLSVKGAFDINAFKGGLGATPR